MIQPTEIQFLELVASGECTDSDRPLLSYNQGWRWSTCDRTWACPPDDAATALLEHVCTLDAQITSLRIRARLGDALEGIMPLRDTDYKAVVQVRRGE